MAIYWKHQLHADAIFTFANHEQEQGTCRFRLDVNESEDRVIYHIIQSMFDINSVDELELMSDIVKVSFCFAHSPPYPRKISAKEDEEVWKLPVMKAFLERNGKYYFDEEQRDEVESSIKELLDCWQEEIV